jgi:hypothetical protein
MHNTKQLKEIDPDLNPSNFQVNFPQPIDLGSLQWEVALYRFDGWLTQVNLEAKTLRWSDDNGSSYYTIVVSNGNYTVDDVQTLLAEDQLAKGAYGTHPVTGERVYGITLSPNYNTNRVDIIIDNSVGGGTYTFDLTHAENMAAFLGFDEIVVSSTASGTHIADVTAGADNWVIRTDLHANAYSNGRVSNDIYAFAPIGPPSIQLIVTPIHLKWYQVNKRVISSMTVKLTDQSGTIIDLNGEDVVYEFILRPMNDSN